MLQAANEPPASDKPFQCFGFTSDDAYTQGAVCLWMTRTLIPSCDTVMWVGQCEL